MQVNLKQLTGDLSGIEWVGTGRAAVEPARTLIEETPVVRKKQAWEDSGGLEDRRTGPGTLWLPGIRALDLWLG